MDGRGAALILLERCPMVTERTGSAVTFKRVLLKISGEALMGTQGYGLHPPTVERIAAEVKSVHDLGVEICMVIGGGNIFRGLQGSAQGMERTTADYMGIKINFSIFIYFFFFNY